MRYNEASRGEGPNRLPMNCTAGNSGTGHGTGSARAGNIGVAVLSYKRAILTAVVHTRVLCGRDT